MWSNDSDQPDPTQPEFGPWGPNRPAIGFKLGSFGFIKFIIGLNLNFIPIWCQPDPIRRMFRPWGPTRSDSTQISGPKLGSTQKNGSGLAALVLRAYCPNTYTLADSGFFQNFLYQGGVKSTVFWVFEDLKFKISEGYDQNWCFPDSAQLAVSV